MQQLKLALLFALLASLASAISVELVSPEYGAQIQAGSANLSWVVNSNSHSAISCNLTVNGILFSGIPAENGIASSSVFGPAGAEKIYVWNVACSDGVETGTSRISFFRPVSISSKASITLISPKENSSADLLGLPENSNLSGGFADFKWKIAKASSPQLNCTVYFGSHAESRECLNNQVCDLGTTIQSGNYSWAVACVDGPATAVSGMQGVEFNLPSEVFQPAPQKRSAGSGNFSAQSAPTVCSCSSCSDCNDKINAWPACGVIRLTNNIDAAGGTCIEFSRFTQSAWEDQVLDCQGYKIYDSVGGGQGAFFDRTPGWNDWGWDATHEIRNCVFEGLGTGVFNHQSNLITISNSIFKDISYEGIHYQGYGSPGAPRFFRTRLP